HRTIRMLNKLTTSANWGSNTDTATGAGGGRWSAATSSTPFIMKGLEKAFSTITVATNGVVQPKDLQLVISPALATVMSQTDEIHNYIKGSPYSYAGLTFTQQIGQWGLPPTLYGVNVVIENTVRVTSKKGATRSASFAMPQDMALLMARPDGLENDYEGTA